MGLLADYLPQFLPQDPNQNQAARQGLLQFGAAMLGGRGNFGSILGQGIQAGAGGYNSALQSLQQKALMDAQTKHLGLENDTAQAALDAPGKIAAILNDGTAPAPAAPSPAASLVTGGAAPLSSLPQMSQAPTAQPLSMIPQASTAPQPAAPVPAAQPATQSDKADLFTQYMGMGDKLSKAGYPAQAKPYYEMAQKLKPEVQEVKTAIDPATGQPVQVITFKDGSQKTSSYGALPDNQVVDLGGSQVLIDKNTGKQGPAFAKTNTPDAILNRDTQIKVQDMITKRQEAADRGEPEAVLKGDELRMMGAQYLAGDRTVMMNLGRGKQGAENIVALRKEITAQAKAAGMSGADIAAKMAEFEAIKAGMRTTGTRSAGIEIAANEAGNLAPLALDASRNVARSGFLPFGKAQIMFDVNTNDPAMRRFAMANNALVNAYGQAMARGGTATVSDKEHAREILLTAMDQPSYEAAVQQMQQEIKAAQAAPKEVREQLSSSISGRAPKPVSALPQKSKVVDFGSLR